MPVSTSDTAALLDALQQQDLTIIDKVELQPELEPTARDGRRGATAPEVPTLQQAHVDLVVRDDEDAVLLIEQDGVFSWSVPASTQPAIPSADRVRGARPAGKTVRFTVDVRASRDRELTARRGLIGDLIYDRIAVYALKFVARVAIGSTVTFLERKVRRGLVNMTGLNPVDWRLTSPTDFTLPGDRPARLLLFVHGTFSSTIGSYGALGATPWGQAFLTAVRAHYDAVVGFDHATLADDPMVNASELLAALEAVTSGPALIDVIAFSRGGIVFRTLVEHLLPKTTLKYRIERAIFVACTNGGTALANPDNWHTLIDLYTNMAAATFRLLSLLPNAAAASQVLKELVQGLGTLVKYLASHATAAVPGLAAMRPGGDFITVLNSRQEGQPEATAVSYFAITAEFKPTLIGGDHKPTELPLRLVMALVDGLVDRVMQEANDLVVDTPSMLRIDEGLGTFVRDTFAFGVTPHVYHTSYFTRPEVVNAMTRWLALPAPPEAAADATPRRARKPGVALPPLAAPRDVAMPAAVDTDIIVTDARARLQDVLDQIGTDAPSYVVAVREHAGERLHYCFRSEEVLTALKEQGDHFLGGPDRRVTRDLVEILDLHEGDRSEEQMLGAIRAPAATSGAPSTRRAVVLMNDVPVGVVPEADAAELDVVALARIAASPSTPAERALTRRVMPSFAQESPAPLTRPAERPRRATRGRPGATPLPPPAAPSTSEIECHFLAEMESQVLLNHVTTVEVSISREQIAPIPDRESAAGTGTVDPTRKLLVQVVAKANFALVSAGDDRTEVDPPGPDDPVHLYFDLKAVHAGEGEVWVIVRQRQMAIARLELKPMVVERGTAASGRRAKASADTAMAPPLVAPLDQLLIVEQLAGDSIQYMFELEMPSIGVFKVVTSKPLQVKRDEYVKRLYQEIEDRYLSQYNMATKTADVEAFTAELQAYGATLFEELFPPEMQAVLWQHRHALTSIRVVSTEPFIPWEIVHLREPGQPVDPSAPARFLGQMGLVRWLHNVNGLPPTALRIRHGRARYVIPQYPHPDWQLPSTVAERQYLEDTFGATPVEPQPAPVRKMLAPGAFDLLHFACHGEAEQDNIGSARVVLEGRVEGGSFVPTHLNAATVETFASLRGPGGEQPIVFLNACQAGRAGYKLTGIGGFAHAFLRGGAGAFVGALWSVGDQPAFWFGKRFYGALTAGDTVAAATVAAREAARTAGDATWLAYVVYAHPHARLGP